MSYSESFVRELRQELQRLEAQRRDIDGKIVVLRGLLGGGVQASLLEEVASDVPSKTQEGTFKSVVVGILKEQPGIATPQITRLVRDRGLAPGGQTDLGHRVYNELWRMRQKGEAQKINNGWYVFEPEEAK